MGTVSYGGPTIADGKIFVGTNNERPRDPKAMGDRGVIMCFNEADGSFLWQITHDKLPEESSWNRFERVNPAIATRENNLRFAIHGKSRRVRPLTFHDVFSRKTTFPSKLSCVFINSNKTRSIRGGQLVLIRIHTVCGYNKNIIA